MNGILVIFGASGDLTSRKLIPALYEQFVAQKLRGDFAVVGVARTPISNAAWREKLALRAEQFAPRFSPARWEEFARHIFYFAGDVTDAEMFPQLDRFLSRWENPDSDAWGATPATRSTTKPSATPTAMFAAMPTTRPVERPARIFYLALAPDKAAETVAALGRAGMGGKTPGLVRRLVIEKPFGRDLHSALELNQAIRAVFDESEIFRIDHYLGKETVNNIFILRFANTLFEPLWNRNAIDHVQITAFEAETVNRRGAYYETAGALRDMVQNHLLQLLAVVAMEPPNRFDAQTVRDEKVKVLRAIRPFTSETIRSHVLLGQYDGYRAEPNVAEHSPIETFAALKFFLDNPRWKGVPFYLRTGKGMSCRTTQIWITFKEPAHKIFGPVSPPDAPGRNTQNEPNRLLIQIQPSEGIRLGFLTKMPGTEMGMKNSELVFSFTAGEPPLDDAYGRLLLDLFAGEASLFLRNDEVEAAWNLIDPILRFYAEEFSRFPEKLSIYPVGEWGPDAAEEQMTQDGRHWLNLCPVLS